MSLPLVQHLQGGDLGETAGSWLRSRGVPLPMSNQAYAFDRYKRLWLSSHPWDALAGLSLPSVKGLVSVVLPVYNGEKYLQEALESLLKQTYPQWELIAIDDGSSDRSGEILDRFARREHRVFVIHQENCKLPVALSRGFRQARGQYLTWTSCDNRFHPDFLEKMVSVLEMHPGWEMVFANEDLIGEDGSALLNSPWFRTYQHPRGSEHVYLPRDPSELNTRPNNTVGAAVLYRDRVAYLLGDYSPFQYTVEDYDYWMRANELLNLHHIPTNQPIADYRFHSASLTASEDELGIRKRRDHLMIIDDFRRNFNQTPLVWQIVHVAKIGSTSSIVAQLSEIIRSHGQILLTQGENPEDYLHKLWIPVISVYVTDGTGWERTPEEVGACGSLKVIVTVTDQELPNKLDSDWDLGIAIGIHKNLPHLRKDYQGWLGISQSGIETLFTAIDIRARNDAARRIEMEMFHPCKSRLKVSIIICTYRRSDQLINAITSLIHQSFPIEDFEVIIVDNFPSDPAIREKIDFLRAQCFTDNPERLKYVSCPVIGLSNARNAGISAAQGEILCFIDDDAIPKEDWLQQVWNAFAAHPEAGVVGGSIRLQVPEPRPTILKHGWEKYWSQYLPPYPESFEIEDYAGFPWGANWSARRKALVEIGGFRSGYGRKGDSYASHEEIVAACLIRKLGYKIAVEPNAEVLHEVSPERFTYSHIRKIIRAGVMGNYQGRRDLYFPPSSASKGNSRTHGAKTQRSENRDAAGATQSWKNIRLLFYHALARFDLLRACLSDYCQRLKKPVSSE